MYKTAAGSTSAEPRAAWADEGGGSLCLQHSDCVCSRWLQMALSAAAPFYRGYVSDIDCRWGVISASVDDRTREERGLEVGILSP